VDQGDGEHGAKTESERILVALGVFIPLGYHVCDVNRSPVDDGTSSKEPTHKGKGDLSDRAGHRNLSMVRHEAQAIAKHLIDRSVIRIAQARSRLDQRIKYPLQIERRPADDLQDIGGGRLLFQGFCQLEFARLLSWNSREFSKAITAWSAKDSSRAACLSSNGATRVRASVTTPMG